MNREKRDLLVDAYVSRIVDSMDMNTLVNYAHFKMYDVLEDYDDAALVEEISLNYPDLLED